MAEAMMAAAGLVLLTVAIGLVRILRGPSRVDRLMAVQLLGSGGAAALLLLAAATGDMAVIDVALILALLAAFCATAFAVSIRRSAPPAADAGSPVERP